MSTSRLCRSGVISHVSVAASARGYRAAVGGDPETAAGRALVVSHRPRAALSFTDSSVGPSAEPGSGRGSHSAKFLAFDERHWYLRRRWLPAKGNCGPR